MRIAKPLIIFILLFNVFVCHAQNSNQIRGKILLREDNSPLPGANIVVHETKRGTISDAKGNFQLKLSNEAPQTVTVTFSFLGMESQTLKINPSKKSYFEIHLEERTNQLKQVVVTSSYGTTKLKEEVVGSITSLQSKDIQADQSFESVDKMLQGQIAGVNIEAGPGLLNPVEINIRGKGSLEAVGSSLLGTSTQPLIIIDNVIMGEETAIDNSFFNGGGALAEDFSNPLAHISPDDIESVNVLKDAAAVSIYGADGANGVIIITTKKGKKGTTRVNATVQMGVSKAINRLKYMNGQQYQALRNHFLINNGEEPVAYNGIDTDWFDLLNRNGAFNKYSANISGGNDQFTFRVGTNYVNIKEPQLGNGSQQYRMNARVGYQVNKFRANLSLNPSLITKEAPNMYYNYAFPPNLPVYNADGSFAKVGVISLGNPLAALEQNTNKSENRGIIGSIDLSYDITDFWNLFTAFGMDYKDKEQDRYFSGANESAQYNGTFELNGETYPKWGRRLINQRQSQRWNWQGKTSLNLNFNDKHFIDFLAGGELSEDKTDFNYASGVGFVNPDIINPVSAAIQDDDPETSPDETLKNQTYRSDINNNSRVSVFSQFNYNFRKKYFLLMNVRRDQSSVFGDNSDVAYNAGAGLSWILSKEPFFLKYLWLDFLRLRVSYGTTGNSRIGSYSSKGIYSFDDEGGYNGLPYATPYSAPNPYLTWETNRKFNAGVDINFLTRFNFTVEYFHDNIQDMITSRDVPSETGYSSVQINGASMYNRGIELSLRADLIKNPVFKWDASFNFSSLENEITSVIGLGDDYSSASEALALKLGESTSTIWGVRWAGVDPATGRDLIEKNGEIYDAITYRTLFSNEDWEPIGNTQPDFYGGFSTSLTFRKRLSLSIRGVYKYGGDKLVDHNLISNYRVTSYRNLTVNAIDYWTQPGDQALLPAVYKNNPIISNLSRYIYDMSHLKISNISMTYKVPVKRNLSFIRSLALNFDVSNVFYFYKQKSPEGRNGIRELRYNYPQSRTFTFGLKAGF